MQFTIIKYLFTNKTTDALFWVLMHSLWQGLLLAVFTGLILLLTKRSAALLRYNLLCGILALFIAGTLFTFYYEIKLTTGSTDAAASKIIPPAAASYIVPSNTMDAKLEVNIIESFFSFIRSNENFIVLAWFLIIGFRCVRLLTGLRSIYILKRRQTSDAGAYWNTRLKELARRIGVRKTVVLLRSAIAKVPMVAGHLKPVILFPAAILTELPQEEIEAILLHELAHIRRKDYLVNMLQSFAEVIFFFNPAVLWISSLIRDERENCCDDIAIGEVKNKQQFIHALVSFQEYNLAPPGYATSFPGRKHQLLNRVKRIITNNNKTLNNMEKIFLASGIIISVFILTAFSHTSQQPAQETAAMLTGNEAPFNQTDTIPLREKNESRSTINTSMDGKQYRIVEINGKVTELYVNNERIPGDKISQYKPTIDKIHQQAKADAAKQAEQMKLQQKEMMKQSEMIQQKQLLAKEQMEMQAEQMKLEQKELMAQADVMKTKEQLVMKQQMEMQAEQMKLQQKELMAQSELMKQKEQLMKAEMEIQAEQMKMHQKEMMAQSELMKQKETLMKKEMEQQSEQMKSKKEEIMKQMEELKTQQQLMEKKIMDSVNQSKPIQPKGVIKPVAPNSITKEIVQNLKKENLVNDAENLSFNLTNEQLTVNGTRQPEQVFQKLKAKYIKDPNDHIFYSSTKGSSHSDISFTTVDN